MPCNGTAILRQVSSSMETLHKHPASARACPTLLSPLLAKIQGKSLRPMLNPCLAINTALGLQGQSLS